MLTITIYLNYFDSKDVHSIDFFKDMPFIEQINIDGLDVQYAPIYHLTNLRRAILSVNGSGQHLNFEEFKYLETLSVDWYNDFPDLSKNKSLKELYIWKFRPKSKSFKNILLPANLNLLHVTESNIESFDGVSWLIIKQLEAHYCSKLKSLKGLEKLSGSLESLILENCKNIVDFEPIGSCSIMKKLILTKCGNIPNLKWLASIKDLKMFTFLGTNILDGDLSYCFGIDYVYFNNTKHYNHKVSEFAS